MRPFIHHFGNGSHFQWNLDASVGKGGQNSNRTDVTYLQWYYTVAAANVRTPPERKAVYSRVAVTGLCRGTDDDPLVQAIFTHQRALSHPIVDGRVSVATGDGRVGEMAFFVLRLGARFADMLPHAWPRLDLVPGCPAAVAEAVRACVPKVPAG
jgi:hypothetical protein